MQQILIAKIKKKKLEVQWTELSKNLIWRFQKKQIIIVLMRMKVHYTGPNLMESIILYLFLMIQYGSSPHNQLFSVKRDVIFLGK